MRDSTERLKIDVSSGISVNVVVRRVTKYKLLSHLICDSLDNEGILMLITHFIHVNYTFCLLTNKRLIDLGL